MGASQSSRRRLLYHEQQNELNLRIHGTFSERRPKGASYSNGSKWINDVLYVSGRSPGRGGSNCRVLAVAVDTQNNELFLAIRDVVSCVRVSDGEVVAEYKVNDSGAFVTHILLEGGYYHCNSITVDNIEVHGVVYTASAGDNSVRVYRRYQYCSNMSNNGIGDHNINACVCLRILRHPSVIMSMSLPSSSSLNLEIVSVQTLYVGTACGTVTVWRNKGQMKVGSYQSSNTFTACLDNANFVQSSVTSITVTKDMNFVITGHENGDARIWNNNGSMLSAQSSTVSGSLCLMSARHTSNAMSQNNRRSCNMVNNTVLLPSKPFAAVVGAFEIDTSFIKSDTMILVIVHKDGVLRCWDVTVTKTIRNQNCGHSTHRIDAICSLKQRITPKCKAGSDRQSNNKNVIASYIKSSLMIGDAASSYRGSASSSTGAILYVSTTNDGRCVFSYTIKLKIVDNDRINTSSQTISNYYHNEITRNIHYKLLISSRSVYKGCGAFSLCQGGSYLIVGAQYGIVQVFKDKKLQLIFESKLREGRLQNQRERSRQESTRTATMRNPEPFQDGYVALRSLGNQSGSLYPAPPVTSRSYGDGRNSDSTYVASTSMSSISTFECESISTRTARFVPPSLMQMAVYDGSKVTMSMTSQNYSHSDRSLDNDIRSESDSSTIPEPFVCPITLDVMQDPVILIGDGISYDRDAIERWFKNNASNGSLPKSPSTNISLESEAMRRLVPNVNLRSAIEEWRRTHY